MTDPRKQFDSHKTVRMKRPLARAIEQQARRQKISEGELMRRWLIAQANVARLQDKVRTVTKMKEWHERQQRALAGRPE